MGPEEAVRVERMLDVMAHRGPDGRGLSSPGMDLCMGAVRLAIVDPAQSDQPLRDATGQLHLIFNGEIYNYRELRAELGVGGHRFSTAGDGEVIFGLYRKDPEHFAARLDGMFAFALWDAPRRRLLIGRDRCGIKPLLYWRGGDRLVFASEAKGLLSHPAIPLAVDQPAMAGYLQCRFPFPPRSAFAGVRKVPPGSVLMVEPCSCRLIRYWDPSSPVEAAFDAEPFGAVLGRAVETTTRGLDPAGFFLSGGLDSSTVVALAAEAPGRAIRTFSVGYHGGWEDERERAREVADHVGVDKQETVLADDAVNEVFHQTIWHLEEPVYTPVTLSTYAVSALAARRNKVAVSGDGADELLLGYAHFRESQELADTGSPWEQHYWRALGWMRPDLHTRLVADDIGHRPEPGLDRFALDGQDEQPVDAMRRFEFEFKLTEYHLTRVDRLAMAHGLEVRVPFLRNEVVDWALSQPAGKLLSTPAKQPLREVAADRLPARLAVRPKQKFTAPAHTWLAGPLRALACDLLRDGTGADELGLRPEGVRELARDFGASDAGADTAAVWGVIVLLAWHAFVYQPLRAMRRADRWSNVDR